jgi:hypothetical protein
MTTLFEADALEPHPVPADPAAAGAGVTCTRNRLRPGLRPHQKGPHST